MTFHETILNQLKKYRETHPNFNFIPRQRGGPGKRFKSGYWFQGNDKYAFVTLVHANGRVNKTKGVGLVFRPKEDGFDCNTQVRYDGNSVAN
ncbi:hypothetical protein [Cellulophaga baltica]|uniref:Uncharacterized protein n=1 Tax=Cellulophaga baltica TaxID=76594 RepID=A0A1G7HFB7_9FLAO|nr:hypothetical protein [Cellulophaga baltica]SDE99061.1 hypothetical protein SAMN04487992_10636 [Cellulophaga baltica]